MLIHFLFGPMVDSNAGRLRNDKLVEMGGASKLRGIEPIQLQFMSVA